MDYLYDETFEGFLTCVYLHYYGENASGIFPKSSYQESLLNDSVDVETDEEKASIVYDAIEKKASSYDLQRIYRVFHTDIVDKEMKMLRYIRLAFKNGSKIRLLHGNSIVTDVQEAEQKLGREVHRYCGIVRFSVICEGNNEILYSTIEPDNDVLQFLAPHFTDRFHKAAFIIHDIKRGTGLVSFNREWYIAKDLDMSNIKYAASEEEYRALWRQYFDIMAIKERVNPKCQKNFLPVRYWKHLPEINL